MLPTFDQIQRAAYHLWLSRGQVHGRHRQDWHDAQIQLTFNLNYRTIVEYALDGPARKVLGDGPIRQCRFCERDSDQVEFSAPRPMLSALVDNPSLFTAEVCDECHADCLGPLDDELKKFWKALRNILEGNPARRALSSRKGLSVAALKSLIAPAFLILPASELMYFPDALEWINNPDHDCDASLFAGISCQAYDARSSAQRPSISVAKRLDDGSPLPYMICLIQSGGIVVHVPLPLCLRDQDLDGRVGTLPDPPLSGGDRAAFHESPRVVLTLGGSPSPLRRDGALHRVMG
jgi:Protein of unknown function (DUF2934)